jgi:TRAP-type mannitol/chloroaromatic compound transport system substrate-binding protein
MTGRRRFIVTDFHAKNVLALSGLRTEFTKLQALVGPRDRVSEDALPSVRGGMREGSAMTERRKFIAKAGGLVAAVAAATIVDAPNVIAQPKVQWRMSTAYTAVFDILQGAAQAFAKIVEEMTARRFRIEVFPGGQIMQPFECFDAASQGKYRSVHGHDAIRYEKEPALEWFATIPFGMNSEGMAAWYHQGDGLKLWGTPMARKVHASFTKFQALVGPWDHVAEGAYHQFVALK